MHLKGEGEYKLDVMKQIEVTESYLGLDQHVIGCQNDEPFENCTTRHYMDHLMAECGCIPPNLSVFKKVILFPLFYRYYIYYISLKIFSILRAKKLHLIVSKKSNHNFTLASTLALV